MANRQYPVPYASSPGSGGSGVPTASSGGNATFIDDFISATNGISVTAGSNYQSDTVWAAIQISGGTQSLTSTPGTFQNPGQMLITTAATSGQGCSMFKGGGGNTTGPLGFLGNNVPWQYDAWIITAATITNYAVRVGLAKGGQQAADAPNSGFWWEYDTANASSNTDWTMRTVSGGVSNYTASSVVPAGSTLYHLMVSSNTAGTISFQIGTNNGALGAAVTTTTDVDGASSMMPIVQVLPRSNAAVTLTLDRITYFSTPGRV